MKGRGRALAPLLGALLACSRSSSHGTRPTTEEATRAPGHETIAEMVYEGGLQNGWQDWGWSPREAHGPGPAQVHFAHWGGWILAKPGPGPASRGDLVFRVKEPRGEAEFLEVRVDSAAQSAFPRIPLSPKHRAALGDGWVEVKISMQELDPGGAPFDRIVLRALREMGDAITLLDRIGFAKLDPSAGTGQVSGAPAAMSTKPARLTIACDARATKISPRIYGIGGISEKDPQQWDIGATLRRWGGNATSTFNWELGVWNSGRDWFFENHPSDTTWAKYLAEDADHGVMTALTVPMLGWVAKDGSSASFPVSEYGPQEKTDPYHPELGDGTSKAGAKLAPKLPPRASVPAPPEWVRRWVATIRAADARTGKRSVHEYILDNEPMAWNQTHRDVFPEPLGYDELLRRTIDYGTAVRQADPEAVIAGPAEWGWTNYFYSAKDVAIGPRLRPDRRMHGDLPLVEWYLNKLREHEQKTSVRILDVLDLHYYPPGENIWGNGTGGSDPKTQALRLRATRSLWDTTYKDESWIDDTVRLLPRMKEWVDKSYPGRGISIGEWNFGGEGDVTGALATAEALGRFAQFGVTAAEYWTVPPQGSPSLQGFIAYRNFDGRGGHFLDWYLPTSSPTGLSLFASRDAEGKHLVLVVINMAADTAILGTVDMGPCGDALSREAYGYVRGASGFTPLGSTPPAGAKVATFEQVFLPWSITVLDVRLAQALAGGLEP